MSQKTYPIILVAPHAQSSIEEKTLRDRMALTDYEIWKCSDPFTGELKEFTCPVKKHIAKTHRLVCDFNRAPTPTEAFRECDFFGRKVFKPTQEFTLEEKENHLQQYWYPFHQGIIQSIQELDKKNPGCILVIDYHNTAGDHPLNEKRDYMPSLIISNLGREKDGELDDYHPFVSIPPKYLKELKKDMEEELPLITEVNQIFYGGYDIVWYAHLKKELGLKSKLYAVQVEYNLDLITNPLTKKSDKKALTIMQKALNESFIKLYKKLK